MRNLSNPSGTGSSEVNPLADATISDKVVTDKNDQTKEEQKETKEIKEAELKTSPSAEPEVVNQDNKRLGTVVPAVQVSTVPQSKQERADKIKEINDEKRAGLDAIIVEGHDTVIKPFKNGGNNFIVDCSCQWQGRSVTIREANELAMNHKKARAALLNKNK